MQMKMNKTLPEAKESFVSLSLKSTSGEAFIGEEELLSFVQVQNNKQPSTDSPKKQRIIFGLRS